MSVKKKEATLILVKKAKREINLGYLTIIFSTKGTELYPFKTISRCVKKMNKTVYEGRSSVCIVQEGVSKRT